MDKYQKRLIILFFVILSFFLPFFSQLVFWRMFSFLVICWPRSPTSLSLSLFIYSQPHQVIKAGLRKPFHPPPPPPHPTHTPTPPPGYKIW